MIYVALANAAAIAVVVISFAGIIRWLVRQHTREREQLVNQVCYLSGRAWAPPPSDTYRASEPDRDWANEWESATPEQMVT